MALDRAYLGQAGLCHAADVRGTGPGRHDDVVGTEAAAIPELRHRTGGEGPYGLGDEPDAAGTASGHQSAQQGAVVHVVISGHLDTPAQRRGQRRHQGAALRGGPPVCSAAQRVLVGQQLVEGGAVGRIERNRQRPGLVVADVVPRCLLQRGGEGLPALGRLEQQRGQGRLPELGLGDRGQHPGRHPGGTVAPGGGGDQRDLVAVAVVGQLPGAGEPDHPSTHHEHPRRHRASL